MKKRLTRTGGIFFCEVREKKEVERETEEESPGNTASRSIRKSSGRGNFFILEARSAKCRPSGARAAPQRLLSCRWIA